MWWIAAGAALALAIIAGIGDWRRKRRADLDRISVINWPTVQVVALIACAILVSIAFNA